MGRGKKNGQPDAGPTIPILKTVVLETFSWAINQSEDGSIRSLDVTLPTGERYVLPFGTTRGPQGEASAAERCGNALAAPSLEIADRMPDDMKPPFER